MHDIYTTIAALKEKNRGRVFLTRENDKLHTLVIDTSAFLDPRVRPYHQEKEAVAQLQHLICAFITHLYSTTLNNYLAKFQAFLTAPDDYAENNKSRYHYPVFELYIRNTTIGGPHASRDAVHAYELRPYGYLTDPGMYEATITCPTLYEAYLARQIRNLLKNHAPVIRVRPGICPIPIHFAIEAYGLGEIDLEIPLPIEKIDVAVSNLIPLWFDVPKLSEIHDIAKTRSTESFKIPSLEFINDYYFQDDVSSKVIFTEAITAHHREGSHKSVDFNDPFALDAPILHAILQKQISMKKEGMYEYKVHPLSLFNADRVDYSLGRIKHYTKTSPADFQNFVIFTNYQMYVDEFLKYCLSRLVLAAAMRRERICDLRSIVARVARDGLIVTEQQLTLLASSNSRIVVPLYKPEGQSDIKREGPERFLTVASVLDSGLLEKYRDVRLDLSGGPRFKTALDDCIESCLWSVFGGRDELERVRRASPSFLHDRYLIEITRRLLTYFIGGRISQGLMGPKAPQMPAFHLWRDNCAGISLINIGVGPSNAKTMTDHLAVLRPHVWLMLGHCAGVRATQQLGHYVLANGYLRADGILDSHIKPEFPIPPINEIHDELIKSFNEVTGASYLTDHDHGMSPLIRTGAVATVMDRNWELTYPDPKFPLEAAKTIGLDMESATIAANGFRFSVPYATFLCVSDRPLHGDLKLEGMADKFYRNAVRGHFRIAIKAVERLCLAYGEDGIGTRKLRERSQPPFQ